MSALLRIAIVGGGAGGIELAAQLGSTLGKKRLAEITLIDTKMTHIWKPLLHEVATGHFNAGEDEVNYFSHGHRSGYKFKPGSMIELDRHKRTVQIGPVKDKEGRLLAGVREHPYDTLVLALGGASNDFGIPGVKDHCVFLESPPAAEYLRMRILGQALAVVTKSSPIPKLRIGIVGAGPTGVELAAEIHHTICELRNCTAEPFDNQLELTIINKGPRILNMCPESMSAYAAKSLESKQIEIKNNCDITSVTEKEFVLADGTLLEKEIKIWAAGVKGPDCTADFGLPIDGSNRIKVNEYLQTEDPNIFAIGDCAAARLPATAQVAHQQATWMHQYLIATRLKNEKYDPFKYVNKGMLVSLGSNQAVGSLPGFFPGAKKNICVSGFAAKLIYISLYRQHQIALYGLPQTGLIWMGDKLRYFSMPHLKLH